MFTDKIQSLQKESMQQMLYEGNKLPHANFTSDLGWSEIYCVDHQKSTWFERFLERMCRPPAFGRTSNRLYFERLHI